MVWSWQENGPVSDKEAGLYIAKSNRGRDDFYFFIKKINSDQTVISFQATTKFGREFSELEIKNHPGFGCEITYLVARNNLSDYAKGIIEEALFAYCNGLHGYRFFKEGRGVRAIVKFEYVDHLEGL